MSIAYIYPQTVRDSFLSAVEQYRLNGEASHPVLDMKMMVSMLNTIRVAPKDAWDFITQVTNMITDAVFDKYSDDHEFANRTIREWDNVMIQFFIVSLNKSLNDVEQLTSVVDELIAGKSTTAVGVPVPDVDPSEVFKGIEWINMKEWITPDASA
jgi:hypothetical protein